MTYIAPILPLVVILVSFLVMTILLARPARSLLQKAVLYCSIGVILLQAGTYFIVSTEVNFYRLWGGKIVFISLCLLMPLSARLALLWGKTDGQEVLRRFRWIILTQWTVSAIFALTVTSPNFAHLAYDKLAQSTRLEFGVYGKLFLVYLIIAIVFLMSILERKLRFFRRDSEMGVPTLIFLAICGFFVIGASQGLLIKTLNVNVLLLVSFCIALAYAAPLIFSFKLNFDRLFENRESIYSSAIVGCIGVYLIVIGILSRLMNAFGWDLDVFFSSLLAIAAAVLFVALFSSSSVKKRVRYFVDKAIYGGRFDYRSLWHRFSEETSFRVCLDELIESILQTTVDIVQASGGCMLLTEAQSSELHIIKKKTRRTLKTSFCLQSKHL